MLGRILDNWLGERRSKILGERRDLVQLLGVLEVLEVQEPNALVITFGAEPSHLVQGTLSSLKRSRLWL